MVQILPIGLTRQPDLTPKIEDECPLPHRKLPKIEIKTNPSTQKKEGKTALHTNFSEKLANVSFKKRQFTPSSDSNFWLQSKYNFKVEELLILLM